MKSALLLSGGMDSVALAYWMKPSLAITMDYGQVPAAGEVRASKAVAEALGIPHKVLQVDCSPLGSGDLIGRAALPIAPMPEWWPFRNQLLLTLAAMSLAPEGVGQLWIGTVLSDGAHADGTPAFIDAMNHLLALQEGGMQVAAPAIGWTSAELIQRSGIPRDLLAYAHSCHTDSFACGQCRGCCKHYETLEALGFEPY
ncbi:MAG: 7-cyano-7-deazaguanine synthase [Holophagaceae bacterium]|nr:7-cyano-7-deazaguanine synthase [Holophagaceae bacterium]